MRDLGSSDNRNEHKIIEKEKYSPSNDSFIYRTSILALVAFSLGGMGVMAGLAFMSLEIPQGITAVVSGALGALVALFAKK